MGPTRSRVRHRSPGASARRPRPPRAGRRVDLPPPPTSSTAGVVRGFRGVAMSSRMVRSVRRTAPFTSVARVMSPVTFLKSAAACRMSSSTLDDTMFRTSSWTSRNWRRTRPTDRASSGRRSGPTTISATARTTRSSNGPTLSMGFGRCPAGILSAGAAAGRSPGGCSARETGCRVGGARRLVGQPVRERLELLLQAARGPSEEDHVTNQETDHDEQRGGRDETHYEPHDEPRVHAKDATGMGGRPGWAATTRRSRRGTC